MPLAGDADGSDEKVRELASRVPNARMLPFVILADSAGTYLAGHSGLMNMPRLIEILEAAAANGEAS